MQSETTPQAGDPAGRRIGHRKALGITASLTGYQLRLEAKVVDISFTGALLQIEDGAVTKERDPVALAEFCDRHLDSGIMVSFGGDVLTRRVLVIRRAVRVGFGRGTVLLIACRFTPALTPEDCELLGLDPRETLNTISLDFD